MDIVLSRNVENSLAEPLITVINRKNGREILQLNVGAAIIGILGQAERNGVAPRSAQTSSIGVVRTEKHFAGGLFQQSSEHCLDCGQVPVKIEVFLLYI